MKYVDDNKLKEMVRGGKLPQGVFRFGEAPEPEKRNELVDAINALTAAVERLDSKVGLESISQAIQHVVVELRKEEEPDPPVELPPPITGFTVERDSLGRIVDVKVVR